MPHLKILNQVIAVHCKATSQIEDKFRFLYVRLYLSSRQPTTGKAGKGRTGLIMVSYLLYGGLRRNALTARAFYDKQRTFDKKGLTIISQIRYAHYFEEQLRRLKNGQHCCVTEQSSPAVLLQCIRLLTVPHFERDGGCTPALVVSVKAEYDLEEHEIFHSDSQKSVHVKGSDKKVDLSLPSGGFRVAGDVHIVIWNDSHGLLAKSAKICHFWIHTSFLQHPPSEMAGKAKEMSDDECRTNCLPHGSWSLILGKHEIDMAAQDKKHARFDADFKIEVFFTPLPHEHGAGEVLDQKVQVDQKPRALYFEKENFER